VVVEKKERLEEGGGFYRREGRDKSRVKEARAGGATKVVMSWREG